MYSEAGRGVSVMRRSSRQPIGRRSDSRRTANSTGTSLAKTLVAVPERGGRLSEGVVVEASIVARLLGLRLLVIDARMVLAPSQLRDASSAGQATPPVRPHGVGARLAAAQRLLDDA
jgi:hypothetical protein